MTKTGSMNAEERRAQLNRINKVHSREADPTEPAPGAPRHQPGHVLEAKAGGYLVKSRSTAGVWWLVHGDTCSCPAGTKGAERCWHRAQVAAFCKALDVAMARPTAPVARRMLVEEPERRTCAQHGKRHTERECADAVELADAAHEAGDWL